MADELYYSLIMLGIVLFVYVIYNLAMRRSIANSYRVQREISRDVHLISLKYTFERIGRELNPTGANSSGIRATLKEIGITKYNLNKRTTKKFLRYIIKKYSPQKVRIDSKYSKPLVKLVYNNLQLILECGPYYRKVQRKTAKKMKNISNADIEKYLKRKLKNEYSREMVNEFRKNMNSKAARDMSSQAARDMQNHMVHAMQHQIMFDMQNQMMHDMQHQMMMDMQNQMMHDMQQQMMHDMQNQMQTQMMHDMQHQMMHDTMAHSMHESQMAITPMHDGGHMMDMNNMHMGGL